MAQIKFSFRVYFYVPKSDSLSVYMYLPQSGSAKFCARLNLVNLGDSFNLKNTKLFFKFIYGKGYLFRRNTEWYLKTTPNDINKIKTHLDIVFKQAIQTNEKQTELCSTSDL